MQTNLHVPIAYKEAAYWQRYVYAISPPPSPVSPLTLHPTASIVDEVNESMCTISLDQPIHPEKN